MPDSTPQDDESVTRYCARCNVEMTVHRDSDAAWGPVRCDDCDASITLARPTIYSSWQRPWSR